VSLVRSRLANCKVEREPYDGIIIQELDLIVVGLGTAGAIAAITAARNGLRVLGIDQGTGMGGTGTFGAVLGYYYGQRGGIYEDWDRTVMEMEQSDGDFTPSAGVNRELKQNVLEQLAREAKVEIRYESLLTGVFMVEKKVCGVEWLEQGGLNSAYARMVIDATGDAYVCAMAGCELRGGREQDGQNQPFSNALVYMKGGKVCYGYTDSGYVDPYDADSLTEAILSSNTLSTHLRNNYNEGDRLITIASQLGIREGRFIEGEENVTWQSYLEEQFAEHPIFYAYSNLDNHSKDLALESENQQDWSVACSLWGLKFFVPIPLGALVPKEVDGLIVAGRCLAVDHDLAACVRMKRDMQKSGEAAAVAVELAIRDQVPLMNINIHELQTRLSATGCLTVPASLYREHSSNDKATSVPVQWIEDAEEIKQGLMSDKPGIAIWSARRLDWLREQLRQWMMSDHESENLRKHSAFALSLMGDALAEKVLLEIVSMRDPYVPKTSSKYNMVRGFAAIYLLGKVRSVAAVDALCEVLIDERPLPMVERNDEFLLDEDELRFQYISFALTALIRIGDAHQVVRESIVHGLRAWFRLKITPLFITMKGSKEIKLDLSDKLRAMADSAISRWEPVS